MNNKDFQLRLQTKQAPGDVFRTVLNVRKWWTGYFEEEFHGSHEKLGDEFSFTAAKGIHQCSMKITEFIPGKRLVWLVTSSKLSFVEKTDEWTGSRLIIDIDQQGGETHLTFTHEGLTPEKECYDSCTPSWTSYLQNKLLPLISQPAMKGNESLLPS